MAQLLAAPGAGPATASGQEALEEVAASLKDRVQEGLDAVTALADALSSRDTATQDAVLEVGQKLEGLQAGIARLTGAVSGPQLPASIKIAPAAGLIAQSVVSLLPASQGCPGARTVTTCIMRPPCPPHAQLCMLLSHISDSTRWSTTS